MVDSTSMMESPGTSDTDGKMEAEGDREGWLEMNGTDDTNGSYV